MVRIHVALAHLLMSSADAAAAGWFRWEQVTRLVPAGQLLYRSSAPNYTSGDTSQNLDQRAVDFLRRTPPNIDSIISFNQYSYSAAGLTLLGNANITYLHLSVIDFTAPTLAQLREAIIFFRGKRSTLVHCGYGHGRTGTGVTALQIGHVDGQSLEPYANTWEGNHVETREQVSVLAELRNLLLRNKTQGVAPTRTFAIINLETGYYLTVSSNNQAVEALTPVNVNEAATPQQLIWTVTRSGTTSNYTLSNRTTSASFATTLASGAAVGNRVENGATTGRNNLFALTEAAGTDRGLYIISPAPNSNLALSINRPADDASEDRVPVLLASNSTSNRRGLWILYPV